MQGGRTRLLTNASVTAYTHTADVALERGGSVMVCATSQFHLLHSGREKALLFGLRPRRDGDSFGVAGAGHDPDAGYTVHGGGAGDVRLQDAR